MAQLEQGKLCPLLKKDCVQLQCSWYTQVRGKHPQTGQEIDEWACAIAWTPILLIETAKEVRQGAAATESLRNEIVGTAEKSLMTQVVLSSLKMPGVAALAAPVQKEG